MANAKLSEATIQRIRRRRRLEADRQQAATTMILERPFEIRAGGAGLSARHRGAGTVLHDVGAPTSEAPSRRDSARLLPGPCTPADLDRASALLGFPIPTPLQQLLLEVGDGGFGPGNCTFGIERMAAEYLELSKRVTGPGGDLWPAELLPIADLEPGFICLDLASGAIVDWDLSMMGAGEGDAAWQASFVEAAPDLVTWLTLRLDDEPL